MAYIEPSLDPSCVLYVDFTGFYDSGVLTDQSMYNRQLTLLEYDPNPDVFVLDSNELVLNGEFVDGDSNWTPVNCSVNVLSYAARVIPSTIGSFGYITQTVSGLSIDSYYLLRLGFRSFDYVPAKIVVTSGSTQVIRNGPIGTMGGFYVPFIAKSTTATLNLGGIGATSGLVSIIGVSLRKILSAYKPNGLCPLSHRYMVKGPKVSDLGIDQENTCIVWATLLGPGYGRYLIYSSSPYLSLGGSYTKWLSGYYLRLTSGTQYSNFTYINYYTPYMFVGVFKKNSGIGASLSSTTLGHISVTETTGQLEAGNDYLYIGCSSAPAIFHEVAIYNRCFDLYDIKDYYENTKSKYIGG